MEDRNENKKLAYHWFNEQDAICIDDAKLTVESYPVKKVVICKEPGMKEMWCLVCSVDNIAMVTILK